MKYWIWLSLCFSFGSPKLAKLLSVCSSAESIYNLDFNRASKIVGFTEIEAKRFNNKSLRKSENIISECKQTGINILTYDNPLFPKRLKNIPTPPICLYYKGTLPNFDNIPTVCIVGTRQADDYSYRAAWSLSARLSLANVLVVSGGAIGIDSAAHLGAIDTKSPTVALLAAGINNSYLKSNADLRERIRNRGCLISEFPPSFPVTKSAFHQRNRLMSGLCLGVVVIEAGEKSGALITARNATEQGRDVFVVTGKPNDKKYAGSNMLLLDGAKPIFDVEDILCEYYNSFGNIIDLDKAKSFNLSKLYKAVYKKANVSTNTPKKSVTMGEKQGAGKLFAKKSNETLSKKAEIVYNRINSDFFTIDDLRETGFSVSEIFSAVTELELRGLVKAVPGGRYTKL